MSYDNTHFARDLHKIVGRAVTAEHDGDALAIGLVLVHKDGNVQTHFAYSAGHQALMIAGSAILHHAVIHTIDPGEKP